MSDAFAQSSDSMLDMQLEEEYESLMLENDENLNTLNGIHIFLCLCFIKYIHTY